MSFTFVSKCNLIYLVVISSHPYIVTNCFMAICLLTKYLKSRDVKTLFLCIIISAVSLPDFSMYIKLLTLRYLLKFLISQSKHQACSSYMDLLKSNIKENKFILQYHPISAHAKRSERLVVSEIISLKPRKYWSINKKVIELKNHTISIRNVLPHLVLLQYVIQSYSKIT